MLRVMDEDEGTPTTDGTSIAGERSYEPSGAVLFDLLASIEGPVERERQPRQERDFSCFD